jgi:hypothetical protein
MIEITEKRHVCQGRESSYTMEIYFVYLFFHMIIEPQTFMYSLCMRIFGMGSVDLKNDM